MNHQTSSKTAFHRKQILLVEDTEDFYRPIKRWLSKEGYEVTIATTLEEAKRCLEKGHFHVAIIDISLEKDNTSNRDGIRLLEFIEEMGISDLLPRIMLSVLKLPDIILETTQNYNARYVLKDPGYAAVLKEELRKIFEKRVLINFDLEYEIASEQKLAGIAKDVKWADDIQPTEELLTEQIKDLFGKLYIQSNSVYVRPMKPGLTGASILRVEAAGKHGFAPAHVMKVGRRDKIQTEDSNFNNYVKDFLPYTASQVKVAYTPNLGGILYSFLGDTSKSFDEFDDFYSREQPDAIIKSLQDLIYHTCAYWYKQRTLSRVNLTKQYYGAFHLEPARLVQAIESIVPGYDPYNPKVISPQLDTAITNPIDWMDENREDFIMLVYESITHGDLTGRNIMVDGEKKCWLIDFYRTYPSHILRDFLILETDIKFRLMPLPSMADFIRLEETLFSGDFSRLELDCDSSLPASIRKAAKVIHALRHMSTRIAINMDNEQAIREEYLRSLLMATLNVTRLRHIETPRKYQALYATHLICHDFDRATH